MISLASLLAHGVLLSQGQQSVCAGDSPPRSDYLWLQNDSSWAVSEVALFFCCCFWLCFNYVWVLISEKVVSEIKWFWLNSEFFLFAILCLDELISPSSPLSWKTLGRQWIWGPCGVNWNLGDDQGWSLDLTAPPPPDFLKRENVKHSVAPRITNLSSSVPNFNSKGEENKDSKALVGGKTCGLSCTGQTVNMSKSRNGESLCIMLHSAYSQCLGCSYIVVICWE